MKHTTVKIYFPLPFYVPIEDDETYVLNLNQEVTYKFKFKTIRNNDSDTESGHKDHSTTIINEVIYELLDENTLNDLMSPIVVQAIIILNNYLDALRLDADWNFIQNFSISDLPLVIDIEVNGNKGTYITQPTTIVQLATLNNDHARDAARNALRRIGQWYENPQLDVIDKFLSKGIHHLYTEEFAFAIVELQTSFETYIRLCQRIILIKQGKTESGIERAMSIALKNTIQDHLGPALEVNLKFDENPFIKEWYEKLYSLRNKIVHSGQAYISGDSAYEAFDAFQKITNYITGLMVDKSFMNENGKILISDLNKNTPSDVDRQKVSEALRKQGHIKNIEE